MSDTTLRLCPRSWKYILSSVSHNSVEQKGKNSLDDFSYSKRKLRERTMFYPHSSADELVRVLQRGRSNSNYRILDETL